MAEDVDRLLKARGSVYGPFEDNAMFMQALKELFRVQPGWRRMSDLHKEAFDMFAIKLGRIITGNDPNFLDNWADIEGYAKRVQMCIADKKVESTVRMDGVPVQHRGSIIPTFAGFDPTMKGFKND